MYLMCVDKFMLCSVFVVNACLYVCAHVMKSIPLLKPHLQISRMPSSHKTASRSLL